MKKIERNQRVEGKSTLIENHCVAPIRAGRAATTRPPSTVFRRDGADASRGGVCRRDLLLPHCVTPCSVFGEVLSDG